MMGGRGLSETPAFFAGATGLLALFSFPTILTSRVTLKHFLRLLFNKATDRGFPVQSCSKHETGGTLLARYLARVTRAVKETGIQ